MLWETYKITHNLEHVPLRRAKHVAQRIVQTVQVQWLEKIDSTFTNSPDADFANAAVALLWCERLGGQQNPSEGQPASSMCCQDGGGRNPVKVVSKR